MKRNYKQLMEAMERQEWYKRTYHNKSLGDVILIEKPPKGSDLREKLRTK